MASHSSSILPTTCILFGLITPQQTETQLTEYLDELEFLATTAGAIAEKKFFQKLDHAYVGWYFGKGKVEEIAAYLKLKNISIAICDDDLTPLQIRNLEEVWGVQVLDRSALILDIFAMRARTAQSRTQVELAQMQYLLPRLRGMWKHLERQQGGIGSRGPGEKEIETDKRIAYDKIALLKKRLVEIDKQNQTQRKTRGELIRVALVGYTNVGKSTLMQLLSKEEVFVENKLFATLDTLVRKVTFDRTPFLLSDTVGFIRKLPHHLVESFKSTLDEVREADILLHIVDMAHIAYEHHIEVVRQTLTDLKASNKPTILVFNKIDLYRTTYFDGLLPEEERLHIEEELLQKAKERYQCEVVVLSAHTKENIEIIKEKIHELVKQNYAIKFPYLVNFY